MTNCGYIRHSKCSYKTVYRMYGYVPSCDVQQYNMLYIVMNMYIVMYKMKSTAESVVSSKFSEGLTSKKHVIYLKKMPLNLMICLN